MDAYCGTKREAVSHRKRDLIRTMLIIRKDVVQGKIPVGGFIYFWRSHDLFQKNALFSLNTEWLKEMKIKKFVQSSRELSRAALFGLVQKIEGLKLEFIIIGGEMDYKGRPVKKALKWSANILLNFIFLTD